jgi:hypothetical protein
MWGIRWIKSRFKKSRGWTNSFYHIP